MLVIPATLEDETGGKYVQGYPGQHSETLSKKGRKEGGKKERRKERRERETEREKERHRQRDRERENVGIKLD